jgi:hypothetical protein
MTGILASRHPERFRCGILMNPVVNMPFMINITGNTILLLLQTGDSLIYICLKKIKIDIPEWITAECYGSKDMHKWNLTGDHYK